MTVSVLPQDALPRPVGQRNGRLWVVGAILAYVLIYRATYQVSVAPRYDYYGSGYQELSFLTYASVLLLSVLPALWMPVKLERPSQILTWSLYLLVYIPAQSMAYDSTLPRLPAGLALLLGVLLFAGLMIILASYAIPLRRLARIRFAPPLVWAGVLAAFVVVMGYLWVKTRDVYQLVTLEDVGAQREAFFQETHGSLVGYALSWSAAVFYPLFFASAVARRRWTVAGAVILGQAALYGVAGSKGIALSALMLPILAVLVRIRRVPFGSLMSGGAVFLCVLPWAFDTFGSKLIGGLVASVTIFRAMAIPGLATVQYVGFFQDHQLTFGSHVTGLRSLLHYPYPRTIDYTIGSFYYDTDRMGLNANLWVGDGVTAFGLPGILLISVVCAAIFWLLDAAAEGLDPKFSVVALAYGVVNFSNVPLMNNLVTGGLALTIIFFYLWPRNGPEAVRA